MAGKSSAKTSDHRGSKDSSASQKKVEISPATTADKAAENIENVVEEVSEPSIPEGKINHGKFKFLDGGIYEGEFILSGDHLHRDGYGKNLIGPERYEGGWVLDKMHGKGTYYFASGSTYEGEFQNNLFSGHGIYRWTDGAYYVGEWYGNKMHGEGMYMDKDGVQWKGKFINGKYDNGRVFHTLR